MSVGRDWAPLAETVTLPLASSRIAARCGIGCPAASVSWKLIGTTDPAFTLLPAVGEMTRTPSHTTWLSEPLLGRYESVPEKLAVTGCPPRPTVLVAVLATPFATGTGTGAPSA